MENVRGVWNKKFHVKELLDYDKEKHSKRKSQEVSTCKVGIELQGRDLWIKCFKVKKLSKGIHASTRVWLHIVIYVSCYWHINTYYYCINTILQKIIIGTRILRHRRCITTSRHYSWYVHIMTWRHSGTGYYYKIVSGRILDPILLVNVQKLGCCSFMVEAVS